MTTQKVMDLEIKDKVIQDSFLQDSNMVVMGNFGSKVEDMVGLLEDLEEVRGHLVLKDKVEVTYRMCNVLTVRSMVIINHTVGFKGEILMRRLVLRAIRKLILQVIRLQVSMIVCLWCTMEKLVIIL